MLEQNVSASAMANVLIIDDETQIRKFLDIALRAQGYKVLQAENGQQGFRTVGFAGCRFGDFRLRFARSRWF